MRKWFNGFSTLAMFIIMSSAAALPSKEPTKISPPAQPMMIAQVSVPLNPVMTPDEFRNNVTAGSQQTLKNLSDQMNQQIAKTPAPAQSAASASNVPANTAKPATTGVTTDTTSVTNSTITTPAGPDQPAMMGGTVPSPPPSYPSQASTTTTTTTDTTHKPTQTQVYTGFGPGTPTAPAPSNTNTGGWNINY